MSNSLVVRTPIWDMADPGSSLLWNRKCRDLSLAFPTSISQVSFLTTSLQPVSGMTWELSLPTLKHDGFSKADIFSTLSFIHFLPVLLSTSQDWALNEWTWPSITVPDGNPGVHIYYIRNTFTFFAFTVSYIRMCRTLLTTHFGKDLQRDTVFNNIKKRYCITHCVDYLANV